jgi:Holliday junction DNA helicase RuvA
VDLAILSVLSTSEVLNAIAEEDARQLQRAPGVGLKLAQRIVLDLKDKVSTMPRAAGATASAGSSSSDAVDALQSLGYKQSEALKAVEAVMKDVDDRNDIGKIVRAALRLLTKA